MHFDAGTFKDYLDFKMSVVEVDEGASLIQPSSVQFYSMRVCSIEDFQRAGAEHIFSKYEKMGLSNFLVCPEGSDSVKFMNNVESITTKKLDFHIMSCAEAICKSDD